MEIEQHKSRSKEKEKKNDKKEKEKNEDFQKIMQKTKNQLKLRL